jgi:hypothetical protein
MNESTPAAPSKKLHWGWKILVGIGVFFVAMMILGLIVGPQDKPTDKAAPAATSPSTATPTSAAAPASTAAPAAPVTEAAASPPAPVATSPQPAAEPAPAVSGDQQVATAAESYVKQNWGMSPNASWQSFECTPGITCWQPYVVRFAFESGILRPTLQIDRNAQKVLGEKAADTMASFIGFSKEPWAQQIDWVEVTDGSGVHVAQKQVTRR